MSRSTRPLPSGCTARTPPRRSSNAWSSSRRAFFGGYDTALETLRYQLFSALGGTLADAKEFKASAAVLVVHDFDTPKTKPTKHALNAADLEAFVERLGPAPATQRQRRVAERALHHPRQCPPARRRPGLREKLRTVIV